MTMFVAGHRDLASTLAAGAKTAAVARIWTHDPAEPPDSVLDLAKAMTGFEAEVSGQQVDLIVLADASDAALAAALVGTKLPAEVLAVAEAREAPSANGRLIAQLAATY